MEPALGASRRRFSLHGELYEVPASSLAQVVNDLAHAMTLLVRESPLRVCTGQAAVQRVQEDHSWDTKSALMAAVYEKVSAKK